MKRSEVILDFSELCKTLHEKLSDGDDYDQLDIDENYVYIHSKTHYQGWIDYYDFKFPLIFIDDYKDEELINKIIEFVEEEEYQAKVERDKKIKQDEINERLRKELKEKEEYERLKIKYGN